jgi:acetolactate synthase-1/2/3 large subunit
MTSTTSLSVAGHYLAQLAEQGIENIYVNAGTDFAPLAEAYAVNGAGSNVRLPEPVLCAHEGVAVGMAHGAYLVSGRPQAVMFHVSVGTANAICAVANAARDNVPLLVSAGRTPLLESGMTGARDTMIHWAQEMYDQAGMLREFVKWDYELKNGRQVNQVVDRALGLAQTEPKGPVYLTLPREVLAEPMPEPADASARTARPALGLPDSAALTALAQRFAEADFPLIVTSAAGSDRDAVDLLDEVSRRFGIGVAETSPRYLNLPFDRPMHVGSAGQKLYDAVDAVLFLECDVPWISAQMRPRGDAFIAQAGVDPLFSRYPMRSHRSDLTIAGAPSAVLRGLLAALEETPVVDLQGRQQRIGARAIEVQSAAVKRRELAHEASGPITKEFVSIAVGEALQPEAIVFNEYWGAPEHLRRSLPGSYFFLPPAGGLGWALPAALGARHATDGTAVALVGDGAYLFANPAACHHAAAKHGLPVLTVIANNSSWGAVNYATQAVYPGGEAVALGDTRLSDLGPSPAFEAYCAASGGYGERVTERAKLRPALDRALHAVEKEGRQALLNVVCEG